MKEQIKRVLQTAVDRGELAGANVIVLKNGKEILCESAGYRDLENKIPMTRDTILRLYSMSKPITSAAVMILVSRGVVDLTAPVSDYLPEYKEPFVIDRNYRRPAKKVMQVSDLMNMTSGLPYGDDPSETGAQVQKIFDEIAARIRTDDPMSTLEFAQRCAGVDLAFDPGSHFRYGISADILGALVEKVSGMKFGEFLEKEIFEPLGMVDTAFYVPEEKQDRLSKNYMYGPDGKLLENVTDNLGVLYYRPAPVAFESGGAGLCGTIVDYAKFGAMLLNEGTYNGREILPPFAVRFMRKGGITAPLKDEFHSSWIWLNGYGYGNLMRCCENPGEAEIFSCKGEYGWDGWLGTFFSNEPDLGITMVFGAQMTDIGQAGTTIRKLKNTIMCEMAR